MATKRFDLTPEDHTLLHKYDIRLSHGPVSDWLYDGPVQTGPRHVRRSGRGPYWRGGVTQQFVVVLIGRIRAMVTR